MKTGKMTEEGQVEQRQLPPNMVIILHLQSFRPPFFSDALPLWLLSPLSVGFALVLLNEFCSTPSVLGRREEEFRVAMATASWLQAICSLIYSGRE